MKDCVMQIGKRKRYSWIHKLVELGACEEAVVWASTYPSLQEAWQSCKRGDWMLWYAGRLSGGRESPERKKLVLAACQCARISLKHIKKGELRPIQAIEKAEAWANGDNSISRESLRRASYTTNAAASYAALTAATIHDSFAASAASYIPLFSFPLKRSKLVLKECTDIVRKFYPVAPTK